MSFQHREIAAAEDHLAPFVLSCNSRGCNIGPRGYIMISTVVHHWLFFGWHGFPIDSIMYLLNPLTDVSSVFLFFVFLFVFILFGFKQDIWLLQQSIFDLQCNLRDVILCYYNSTDADGAEIHMIWCWIIFLFHLLIDVLSTFMVWIFRDNKNGPVNKGCQVKHVHFNLQEETRNPAV